MKNIILLILLFLSVSAFSQTPSGLELITEGSNMGWRLIGSDSADFGQIGYKAVDLSYNSQNNNVKGATGNFSFVTGLQATASGLRSIAMGGGSIASGENSFAIGSYPIASGNESFALGTFAKATGWHSKAIGFVSHASGDFSFGAGKAVTASGYSSTAIGSYNTIDESADSSSFSMTNRAFVIGNGEATNARSDAFTILFNGNTTTTGSVTATSFIGEGSQLTGLGLKVITEQGIAGWRLEGQDSVNYGNIGLGAVDMSNSSSSSLTKGATGNGAFASGYNTTASGNYSTAMGSNSRALGSESTALGYYAVASGQYSTALGGGTLASGELSTAIGIATTASGYSATAFGSETEANGNFSTATGLNTIASGFATTTIGLFNINDSNANATAYSSANSAFIIGNGINSTTRSNAMTVLFDGTTTIAGDLTINSDVRLKTKINSLGNTLSLIQQLDGKSFYLKNNLDKSKIGLLAQDVQEVFPQLVHVGNGEERLLSVNYQGLIPVLINAVNEQQGIIEKQQKQIDELSELVQKLIESK